MKVVLALGLSCTLLMGCSEFPWFSHPSAENASVDIQGPEAGAAYADGVSLKVIPESRGPQDIEVHVLISTVKYIQHVSVVASADSTLMDYGPIRSELGDLEPSREPTVLVLHARPHTYGSVPLSILLTYDSSLDDGPQGLSKVVSVDWVPSPGTN